MQYQDPVDFAVEQRNPFESFAAGDHAVYSWQWWEEREAELEEWKKYATGLKVTVDRQDVELARVKSERQADQKAAMR